MLFNDIRPLQKFIVTDVLGKPPELYKYSTGYVTRVRAKNANNRPYTQVSVVLTRMGKNGKPRITRTDIYVCPLIYRELFNIDIYKNCGYILTKDVLVSVLDMTNHEFLCWAYACMLRIDNYGARTIWPAYRTKLFKDIYRICGDYSEYNKHYINGVVGTTDKRMSFLYHLRIVETFVKKSIVEEISLMNTRYLLNKHLFYLSANNKYPELTKKVKKLLAYKDIDGDKLLTGLTLEAEDVLHEYENSGYWD